MAKHWKSFLPKDQTARKVQEPIAEELNVNFDQLVKKDSELKGLVDERNELEAVMRGLSSPTSDSTDSRFAPASIDSKEQKKRDFKKWAGKKDQQKFRSIKQKQDSKKEEKRQQRKVTSKPRKRFIPKRQKTRLDATGQKNQGKLNFSVRKILSGTKSEHRKDAGLTIDKNAFRNKIASDKSVPFKLNSFTNGLMKTQKVFKKGLEFSRNVARKKDSFENNLNQVGAIKMSDISISGKGSGADKKEFHGVSGKAEKVLQSTERVVSTGTRLKNLMPGNTSFTNSLNVNPTFENESGIKTKKEHSGLSLEVGDMNPNTSRSKLKELIQKKSVDAMQTRWQQITSKPKEVLSTSQRFEKKMEKNLQRAVDVNRIYQRRDELLKVKKEEAKEVAKKAERVAQVLAEKKKARKESEKRFN